ncbi:glutamate receptor ionotropic, delta-2-like isoform X1 [Penaeus monodon]|uniref:glutamate receptor ionotropic, delta-2-like isoform X1 n=2 Tax=Penaeus monodon TaxID=6687 RepID=UPI0018A78C21|nr:glutamate receptor ionotropic, delta-2-like isoform X1 [Penaeus monodon]
MGGRSLQEALTDPAVFRELQEHPETFRFRDEVSLEIAVEDGPYSTVVEDTTSSSGISVRGPMEHVLGILTQSLNFTYTLVRPPDRGFGVELPNGSWNGMIGLVARNQADIGLSCFMMNPGRASVVDFVDTISFMKARILAGKGSPEMNPMGFLYPLSPTLWAALFAMLLAVWAATLVLRSPARGSRWYTRAGHLLYSHFSTLLQQDVGISFVRAVDRLVVGSWMLVAMVIIWAYGCNLVSLLAARNIPQSIQNLQDLVDSDIHILLRPDTALSAYLEHRAEFGAIENRIVHIGFSDYLPTLEDIRRGTHVHITVEMVCSKLMSQDFSKSGRCDFYQSRDAFMANPMSMIVQRGSPLLQAINHRIRRVLAAGLFDYWATYTIPNVTRCSYAPSTITVMEPLTITAVSGMFTVWASGLVLSLVSFCMEILVANAISRLQAD